MTVDSMISPLAAAAAALWPERAAALLARCPDPAVAAEAAALAGRPRAARLSALAAALCPSQPSPEALRTVAASERPRLAAIVAVVGRTRTPAGVSPVLARLVWERVCLDGDRDAPASGAPPSRP